MGFSGSSNSCSHRIVGYCCTSPFCAIEEEVFTACSLKLTESLQKEYSAGKVLCSASRIFGCNYGGLGEIAIESCPDRKV